MDMYSLLIDASKLDQPVKRLDLLRKLIRDLPEINYETVKYLCAHLCNVVSYCSVRIKIKIILGKKYQLICLGQQNGDSQPGDRFWPDFSEDQR